MFFKRDPGPCIICGAPHTTCTADEITIVPGVAVTASVTVGVARPLAADRVQATLPPGQFTTATYRGTRKRSRPGDSTG